MRALPKRPEILQKKESLPMNSEQEFACLTMSALGPAPLPERKKWAKVWVVWFYFKVLFNILKSTAGYISTCLFPISDSD